MSRTGIGYDDLVDVCSPFSFAQAVQPMEGSRTCTLKSQSLARMLTESVESGNVEGKATGSRTDEDK